MKERETTTQSLIWERLTPPEALNWAERILRGIENGKLPEEVYEPLVDRLINFACGGNDSNNFSDPPVEQDALSNNNHQEHPKTNNKTPHSLGLSQLPPEQQALYKRRQAISRSIFEANKDGRIRVKKNRKH